jgi:hypothetical protein
MRQVLDHFHFRHAFSRSIVMAGARTFTELKFWQRARVWSKEIFDASQKEPFVSDRKLWAQYPERKTPHRRFDKPGSRCTDN